MIVLSVLRIHRTHLLIALRAPKLESSSVAPRIPVVKPSDPARADNPGTVRRSDLGVSAFRGIADRGVDPLRVVVLDVLPDKTSQVLLVQNEHVIEKLARRTSPASRTRTTISVSSRRCCDASARTSGSSPAGSP